MLDVTKPGPVPLRPLDVGDILDGAITAVRTHPKTTFGISAVIGVIFTMILGVPLAAGLRWVIAQAEPSIGGMTRQEALEIYQLAGSSFISWVLNYLGSLLATGIITVVVARSVIGQRLSAKQAWGLARERLWALVGFAAIVLFSIVVIYGGFFALFIVILFTEQFVWLILLLPLGLLLGFVFSPWFYFTLALIPPTIMLEKRGPLKSFSRVIRLTKGIWWRTFGVWLLIWIISAIIQGIIQTPLFFIAGIGSELDFVIGDILDASVSTVVALAVWPFIAAATTLLYLNARMRREGLDLTLLQHVSQHPGASSPGGTSGGLSEPTPEVADPFAAPPPGIQVPLRAPHTGPGFPPPAMPYGMPYGMPGTYGAASYGSPNYGPPNYGNPSYGGPNDASPSYPDPNAGPPSPYYGQHHTPPATGGS